MCPQSEGSSRMIKWEKRVQSGVKSGEADSGWVLERGTSIATARGRKPRQGHVCDAAGGGGLPRPLPFPSARGKGLLGLRCQFQSVRPTLLGPDGNLSVGTELSGEAGLARREQGCYQHGSTVRLSPTWWPRPSSLPSETSGRRRLACCPTTFINSFLMSSADF